MSNNHIRYYNSSGAASAEMNSARFATEDRRETIQRHKSAVVALAVMWAAYIATVALNAVFEVGRLGGVTSADVAYGGGVFTWFTPAGYVFSIWGLIYIGLAIWLVSRTRRLWNTMKAEHSTTNTAAVWYIPMLFLASCALNVLWLGIWHMQLIALSIVAIVAFFVVLTLLYRAVRS